MGLKYKEGDLVITKTPHQSRVFSTYSLGYVRGYSSDVSMYRISTYSREFRQSRFIDIHAKTGYVSSAILDDVDRWEQEVNRMDGVRNPVAMLINNVCKTTSVPNMQNYISRVCVDFGPELRKYSSKAFVTFPTYEHINFVPWNIHNARELTDILQ